MRNELFYLISKRLESCCSFDEVLSEWDSIMDEVLTYRETFVDNYTPVVPVENTMVVVKR